MVETRWEDLRGTELRYRDSTWELTGDVDVRDRGELLVVGAREADDVRGRRARLHFDVVSAPDSLNPGNLGEHFDSLEREGDAQFLVVKKERRTYRYELRRMAYD